jgi:hypothetical protein
MHHRHTVRPHAATSIDITAGVNLRMIQPEDRAMASSSDWLPSDEMAQAISERLPASLRDESIWQYHLLRCRGLIRWCVDHSFRYYPVDDLDRSSEFPGMGANEVEMLLAGYEPTKEALLVNEFPDGREFVRIEENGGLTRLWTDCLTSLRNRLLGVKVIRN